MGCRRGPDGDVLRKYWRGRNHARRLGVIFSHGQEGDQFPKTDRAYCHLDVCRVLAAGGFSRALRLESFLRQTGAPDSRATLATIHLPAGYSG